MVLWQVQPLDCYQTKRRCCNLSGGVALVVWFTTNGMCAKNKNIYMWREQAIIEWSRWSDLGEWPLTMLVNLVNSWLCLRTVTMRVIFSGVIYCCLLPRCEALRTCRSGFPIATAPRWESNWKPFTQQTQTYFLHYHNGAVKVTKSAIYSNQ